MQILNNSDAQLLAIWNKNTFSKVENAIDNFALIKFNTIVFSN